MKTILSGKTQVYGVIGDPIAHSLSPALQNAAFEALHIDSVFLAFKVKRGEVETALRGMQSLGIAGLNVTMPHKNAVIPYLDQVDEIANFLGSVNTIINDHGKLNGFSTDGIGAYRALEENGVQIKGKKAVLLGGGGAAKAIAYAFAKEVDELILLNRTPETLKHLVDSLNRSFNKKIFLSVLSPKVLGESLQNADILINATSVGMDSKSAQSLVSPKYLNSNLTVMDIVYNPIETKLLRDAKDVGARVISGLEMLVYQGAASFQIWTGQVAPVKVMRKVALNQLQQRVKKDVGKS